MKVDGLDIDVGIEGALIEENRAACVVGHVEPTSKNVMIDIIRSLLQGNDRSFPRNLFFEGVFFSTSGPRVPAVDAEPLLHKRLSRKMFVGTVCLRRCSRSPF